MKCLTLIRLESSLLTLLQVHMSRATSTSYQSFRMSIIYWPAFFGVEFWPRRFAFHAGSYRICPKPVPKAQIVEDSYCPLFGRKLAHSRRLKYSFGVVIPPIPPIFNCGTVSPHIALPPTLDATTMDGNDKSERRLQKKLKKLAKKQSQLLADLGFDGNGDKVGHLTELTYPLREWQFKVPGLQDPIALNPAVTLIGVLFLWSIVIWSSGTVDPCHPYNGPVTVARLPLTINPLPLLQSTRPAHWKPFWICGPALL
jgi:hypothetical protein